MSTLKNMPGYYVLSSEYPDRMLLFDILDPSFDDSWYGGERFITKPGEPVVVRIRPGNENAQRLPFFGTPCVMSDAFGACLREAGVDNLEVFDAVLSSRDGSVRYDGFKAFNLIGRVRAADLSKSTFADNSPALVNDPDMPQGLLMFRLTEYTGAVLVHERLRQAIEAKKLPYVVFRELGELVTG